MKNYGVSLITGLLLCFNLLSFAQQQKLPNTLLWKISGRGLAKPSYLFGTMHLTDKRLFRLDDSVFHSISATQGFAMEINPEEMAAYVVNEQLNNLENKQKLENVLDEEDFSRHKKALGRKFNKDASDITVSDIVQEKNKWVNDFMAKGEMPTMLDAYLYNMARKQGKWIGGIEDLIDQTGLQEDLVDVTDVEYLVTENNSEKEAKKQLEVMVRIYQNSDLNAMERLMNGSQSGEERDVMLIRRNVKMARRMDSLSAIRSMFFAVGAAHLPGDSGVIDLLKRQGFTVEPVFSKKKMNASDYKYKEVEIPWITVKDPEGLYEVMMPGPPVEFKHLGLINMRFHMDLFNLTAYSTFAVSTPYDVSKPDSLFLMLANNVYKTDKGLKTLVIDSADVPGREFVGKVDNGIMRTRLYLKGSIIYMAMAVSMRKDASLTADMKKFFNSFVINQSVKPGSAQLYTFTDSTMGVQVTAPVKLDYNEKITPASSDWYTKAFTGLDKNSGAYIFLLSKQASAGNHIINDSSVLYELFENMEKQYGKLEKRDQTIQGLPALMIEGENIGDEKISLKIFTTVRNNRNIVLMAVAQKGFFTKPEGMKVFESFKLIPYSFRKWKFFTDSSNTFTAWAPAPFEKIDNGETSNAYAHDTIAAISYMVITHRLSDYFSRESDSVYWEALKTNIVGEKDSLISSKAVVNKNIKGFEFVVRKNHSNMYQRSRTFQHGNTVIQLQATSNLKDLYEENANKFFTDFTYNLTPPPFSITTSKSKRLLEDLLSKDSATRQKAITALSNVDFYKGDSTLLQAALLTDYKLTEEEKEENDLHFIIAQKLVDLKSPGTIEFSRKSYLRPGKDTLNIRDDLLYILAATKTRESIATLGQLMVAIPPATELNYYTYTVLLDSLDLALTFINHTKSLRGDSIHGPLQVLMYNRLLDSGQITRQTFDDAENDFIKVANQDVNLSDSIRIAMGNSWHLLQMLGKYNSPDAMLALRGYLNDSRKFVSMEAVLKLLKSKQKVDPATITKFASDPETRLDFYKELKEIKKESFLPNQYKNQKSISESVLYDLDDDFEFTSRSYVGTRIATIKGKQYRFYLWKVTVDSEESSETYLAVIGGFPLDAKNVLISQAYSGYDSSKPLGEYTVDAIFKDFIEYRNLEEEE